MKEKSDQRVPIARKEGLVVKELPEELLVYDLEKHRAHCLNQSAAFVWKACDGKQTVAHVANSMPERLGGPVEKEFVLLALNQLRRAKLLRDRVSGEPVRVVSRRELLRKGLVAAAVTLPLVTSMAAPTPAQAASCASFSCDLVNCIGLNCCQIHSNCTCTGGQCLATG